MKNKKAGRENCFQKQFPAPADQAGLSDDFIAGFLSAFWQFHYRLFRLLFCCFFSISFCFLFFSIFLFLFFDISFCLFLFFSKSLPLRVTLLGGKTGDRRQRTVPCLLPCFLSVLSSLISHRETTSLFCVTLLLCGYFPAVYCV